MCSNKSHSNVWLQHYCAAILQDAVLPVFTGTYVCANTVIHLFSFGEFLAPSLCE